MGLQNAIYRYRVFSPRARIWGLTLVQIIGSIVHHSSVHTCGVCGRLHATSADEYARQPWPCGCQPCCLRYLVEQLRVEYPDVRPESYGPPGVLSEGYVDEIVRREVEVRNRRLVGASDVSQVLGTFCSTST